MMKNRIFALLGLCGCIMSSNAAVQYMTIELKSGMKYSFLLDENPEVTYSSGNMVINGDASTSYSLGGVRRFYFTEGDKTAVKNENLDMLRFVVLDETKLEVLNAPAFETINLVNVNGVVVLSVTADEKGSAVISLPVQKGVYVLSVGAESIKLVRK